jgi:hypothetical protein
MGAAAELSVRIRQGLETNRRMSQQPPLVSAAKPSDPPFRSSRATLAEIGEGGGKEPGSTPPWLRRLELLVRVVVRLYLGLIILVLPWTHFWDENRLLLLIPHLAPVALNGVSRGVISGLGLLNIWIGVHEASHYKET